MMEAVRASETSVDNHFTRQYIPEDNSEHHTRRRENFKSHIIIVVFGIEIFPTVLRKERLGGKSFFFGPVKICHGPASVSELAVKKRRFRRSSP
jgi:hypothetical protein